MRCYNDLFYLYEEQARYWKEIKKKGLERLIKKTFEEADKDIWRTGYSRQSSESLVLSIEDMYEPNPYKYKLNLLNGVYNFRTLKMEPHNEEDYLTDIKDYEISEEEFPTPVFDKFINDITINREELKTHLLMVLAYLISGNKKHQKAFIFKGEGANGKSVLIDLITKIIGNDFVASISLSEFSERFALSEVPGKKLIIASENESKGNLSTEVIKNITGGDMVSIKQKYKDSYSSKVEVEMLFALNNPLKFCENSYGLRRRLVVIPFDFRVKEENMDFDLPKKLEKEIPRIVRKLIGIYFEFSKANYRFPQCDEVEKATSAFLDTSFKESLGKGIFDFLEENIVIDVNERVSKNDVYKAYSDNNIGNATPTKFWMDFNKWVAYKGYKVGKGQYKERYRTGIKLKEGVSKKLDNLFE